MARKNFSAWALTAAGCGAIVALVNYTAGQPVGEIPRKSPTSYAPVSGTEPFAAVKDRMTKEKPAINDRQAKLLAERYDLGDKKSDVKMSDRDKFVQAGVRVKLPRVVENWQALATLSPEEIKANGLFPAGMLPLPHPNHPEGGMLFPKTHIDQVLAQDKRDLKRFDLDFDIPEHFLPAFPAPMYLNTRPDLGDVSKGKLVTLDNYFELFNGILNPKQLEGMRLLVTPFPQQQFNATDDRRTERPSMGVTCFDCHANGHANGATHLIGDIRPQEFRRRIKTPSLRGVSVQTIFGSQRALRTIEDFTEFEQRAAYFDGDPVIATKKGVNILERGSQAHFMAEMENILAFPPAPKLNVFGKLDAKKASQAEMRGQELFFGKAQCSVCHPAPNYTDGTMHDLNVARFHKEMLINGRATQREGPIKTFPLRGIKDSPPYLHDGRLLTLEDTIEFFNLILELKLTEPEKKDLLAFMLAL